MQFDKLSGYGAASLQLEYFPKHLVVGVFVTQSLLHSFPGGKRLIKAENLKLHLIK